MTPSPQESTHDTRVRLMEAALLLFAEKSFDGVGIRDIAQKAGVNSAMVQYHFGGKEGLYVEAMSWVNQVFSLNLRDFPELPKPTDPDAHARALVALKDHLHIMLERFWDCRTHREDLPVSREAAQAAHVLWHREMEHPRPAMNELLLSVIRPIQAHFQACLQILRPDLTDQGRRLMGLSVHGQLLFLHKHAGLIHLATGGASATDDFDTLLEHITQFSLRGLGLADEPGKP